MNWLAGSLNNGVKPREFVAWAMYDFANSAYTTIIITAVFSAYFVNVVAANQAWATLAWTLTLSASYLLVMLSGPAIGQAADHYARRKRYLLVTTVVCIVATAMLYQSAPGAVALTLCLIFVSNAAYSYGENLCAAFLPALARPEHCGRVSGWAWGIGYIGGLLALVAALAYIQNAGANGIGAAAAVPNTAIITAAFFLLGAIPAFIWLKEPPAATEARPQVHAWRLLASKDFRSLLITAVLYQAGIATVVAVAAIYASKVLGFQTADTISLLIVVNVSAAFGAIGFAALQDRIGLKKSLTWMLVAWIVIAIAAWFAEGRQLFWTVANAVGLLLGASQSVGRAMAAAMCPPDRGGEVFGLWGMAVRLAAVIGPPIYGVVAWASDDNHRLAMAATSVFFAGAVVCLRSVDVERGRNQLADIAVPEINRRA